MPKPRQRLPGNGKPSVKHVPKAAPELAIVFADAYFSELAEVPVPELGERFVLDVEVPTMARMEEVQQVLGLSSGTMAREDRGKLFGEFIRGWRGLISRQGTETPFTPQNLQRLLEHNIAFGAILKAVGEAFVEVKARAEGN